MLPEILKQGSGACFRHSGKQKVCNGLAQVSAPVRRWVYKSCCQTYRLIHSISGGRASNTSCYVAATRCISISDFAISLGIWVAQRVRSGTKRRNLFRVFCAALTLARPQGHNPAATLLRCPRGWRGWGWRSLGERGLN
jgi:hypothetical protein